MTDLASSAAWNSLEVAKLAVSALTPVVVLFVGFWFKRLTESIELRTKLSQIEIEWRLAVFKDISPKLNVLFCYFTYVGNWRSLSPDDATLAKRECDRIVNTNRFLWSPRFLTAYVQFVSGAFKEGVGPNSAFQFRANRDMHRHNPNWTDAWADRFVEPSDRIRRDQFTALYQLVLENAVKDLGIFNTK